MFDQLGASTEDKARRFPSSAPTDPPAQPEELPRYDAIAPPHRASGFGRTTSTPEGRQGEPPVLFSRLSSAPAWFPSPHEEVKVMQQSSREAWTIFGRRFHAAHAPSPASRKPVRAPHASQFARHTAHELARRSSAPDAPSRVPSRARETSRRSSVASGARTAASPDHQLPVDAPSRPFDALRRGSTSDAPSRTLEPAGGALRERLSSPILERPRDPPGCSVSHHRSVAPGSGAPQRERPSRPRS